MPLVRHSILESHSVRCCVHLHACTFMQGVIKRAALSCVRFHAGGGSRGLAHLGVLQAMDEIGIPIDVVGGTSQGAFMAALYAQGLGREQLLARVRGYATAMASPRHLLSDITLPVLSLFSGGLFDRVRLHCAAACTSCMPLRCTSCMPLRFSVHIMHALAAASTVTHAW
jgi:Patatin-like phospholipase